MSRRTVVRRSAGSGFRGTTMLQCRTTVTKASRLPLERRVALWLQWFVLLLLGGLLLLPGCGSGEQARTAPADPGRPPLADEVRLVVSRDFGRQIMTDVTAPVTKDITVMRLLAENVEVETAYGGGFVKAIAGVASTHGSVAETNAEDWFYWVDGLMADVGAADFKLRGGQTVWWDYHAWADAMYLPTAIFALPAPWADGEPLLVTNQADAAVRAWAEDAGVSLGATVPFGRKAPHQAVVVATAAEAEAVPWLMSRLAGHDGGVELVTVASGRLVLQALDGSTGPDASGVCLALPDPDDMDMPLLVLLVTSEEDLGPLLETVTPASVSARLGIALVDGKPVPLPWRAD